MFTNGKEKLYLSFCSRVFTSEYLGFLQSQKKLPVFGGAVPRSLIVVRFEQADDLVADLRCLEDGILVHQHVALLIARPLYPAQ